MKMSKYPAYFQAMIGKQLEQSGFWTFHLSLRIKSGSNILFMYHGENGDEDENQSSRSFLYVLKQTCEERTNNHWNLNLQKISGGLM